MRRMQDGRTKLFYGIVLSSYCVGQIIGAVVLGSGAARMGYKLVLFASPNILGVWHDEVPDSLQAKVTREFARNLVRLPYHSLADAIRDALSS